MSSLACFDKVYSSRQTINPAECCSTLIKTEDGCEGDEEEDAAEPEVDVEGVESTEGETSRSENARESSIEPPRRRDSSDPVNLSLNSGASTASDSSHHDNAAAHRLDSSTSMRDDNCVNKYNSTDSREQRERDQQQREQQRDLQRYEPIF